MFRQKYLDYFETAYRKNKLIFPGQTKALGTAKGFKDLLNRCYANRWVVDIRKPIDNPEYVLDYLGRYTHRVAISNNRVLSCDNAKVCFTIKNRDTGQIEKETIDAVEFIRRFLLHVLPKRFMRIRHYGFLSNRNKKCNVRICKKLLGQNDPLPAVVNESIEQVMLRLTGVDITRCARCKKGTLISVSRIPKGNGPCAFAILHPP